METEPVFHSEDVDDELQALYRQRIRERVRVPEMIVEAYRTAWASFYGWEPGYSEHVLRSLQAPNVGSSASNIADLLEMRDFNSMEVDSDPSQVFTVLSTDLGSHPRSFQVHDITLPDVPVEHFAYPKYESCTPATRNISHERDPRILDFIPYADEPDFSLSLYARLHASFAWQNIWYDVDYKLIALHTAWSLYASGLSPKEMDEYQVRFLPPITGSSGLLTTLRNRDLIDWGTAVSSQQLVALWDASLKATRPPGPNLWRSVRSLDAAFCRSTNCIEALCMLHSTFLLQGLSPSVYCATRGSETPTAACEA
ncbi:hypothetical protein L226DRAFT_466963 [Lentinus tigrinus ALCF2SS1-7]|uniref:Uncharacterized protein n=1 Tax=Lentinus tigrinus ALCF2SS1-6 TaxID=1328759 RepID=A0A5C2RVA0_9APHY|nr:hypothetical protein L227DRAFT_636979 [Lentinus tigrinus ALCF2SS1-6]RPD72609.1 hypothetical protein L226DRAFT_466963 [Lentinus tigrinus ALCF2SS1-7]